MNATKKLNLPTYTQALVTVGGVAIVATIIVGGSIYSKSLSKPTTTPATESAPLTNDNSSVEKTSLYDGTYVGSSPVAEGLTDANVTVSGNKISGRGTYAGPSNVKIGLTIKGTVDANGNVNGDFSGTGTVEGVKVTGSGTYSGKVTGNSVTINYSATGAGKSYKGSMVLIKK
jgi:hypothetical protein